MRRKKLEIVTWASWGRKFKIIGGHVALESVGSSHTEEKGWVWQGTNTGLRNLDFV